LNLSGETRTRTGVLSSVRTIGRTYQGAGAARVLSRR
jgi:hypothetical protein